MTSCLQTRFSAAGATSGTKVRIGVGVVVLDQQGHILLEKRGDCGLWGLPGGRIEPGETIEETACREVLEETGMNVEITRLLGVYSDPTDWRLVTYPGESNPVQLVDIVLEARVRSGHLRVSSESERVEFFAPDRIPSQIVPPAVAPIHDFVHGETGVIR